VAGCHDEALLATTEFVQPALLACDVAAFRVLEEFGRERSQEERSPFVGVAGHSLGEFAALVAAGACELAPMLRVVVARGLAMQEAGRTRPGAMSALLGVGTDLAADLCEEARDNDVLVVANENSPVQVVISGSVSAIERAEALAAKKKIRAVRLKVAGAFHSPLMEPAVASIVEALASVHFERPRFAVSENVAGALLDDPDDLRAMLVRHVVSPVRWESCVRALAAAGATTFLEAGPGDVLTKLAKRIVPEARAVAVGSSQDAEREISNG
jgi:[acyl-carrier-protein] S-malonyltransferase